MVSESAEDEGCEQEDRRIEKNENLHTMPPLRFCAESLVSGILLTSFRRRPWAI